MLRFVPLTFILSELRATGWNILMCVRKTKFGQANPETNWLIIAEETASSKETDEGKRVAISRSWTSVRDDFSFSFHGKAISVAELKKKAERQSHTKEQEDAGQIILLLLLPFTDFCRNFLLLIFVSSYSRISFWFVLLSF